MDNTFTIGEGETYQISDVSNYSFNVGYSLRAYNNATLILKNVSQQYNSVLFDDIDQLGENPLNIVVDTGATEIRIESSYSNGSVWYSNLTFKTGSSVTITDHSRDGSSFYSNIVCEEGSVLSCDFGEGTITGDITADGTLYINGGTITGDITASDHFEVNAGSIIGNITANGTLIMNGGSITGDITASGTLDVRGSTINTLGTLFKTEPDYAGHIDISGGEMYYSDYIFYVGPVGSGQPSMVISGGTFYPQNADPNVTPMVRIINNDVSADQYLGTDLAFEYDSTNSCWNVVYAPPPIIG